MERDDTLIDQLSYNLITFKDAHGEHMGYTGATYGIAIASYFRWQGD